MDNRVREILEAVTELFGQYGVKNLTMDEISRHLGISKKTLYQYFKDKKELVHQCLTHRISNNQERYKEAMKNCSNAIDCLMMMNKMVSEELGQIQPMVIFELKRYYPEAFEVLSCHKGQFIYGCIEENIKWGMEEGLYRDNLDPAFISDLYIHMVDFLITLNPSNSPDYSLSRLHRELIRYHIRGIASLKGIEYLSQKFKSELS